VHQATGHSGPTGPRRRALLASAALPLLLGVAGCRTSDAFAGPDPLAGRPPLGHDVLTLQAVIAAEENLIALYHAAIGTPATARAGRKPVLTSLLGQHEQHLAQLKAMLVIPPGTSASPSHPAASASGSAGSGVSASASASGTASPRPARVSIARLQAAERASAAGLVQQLATLPPALAQLFASIAASDATHATALAG
jgi:hypothetical protein